LRLVNVKMCKFITENEILWRWMCRRLWAGKVCVPEKFVKNPCWHSYFMSKRDARRTVFESESELSGLEFHMRLKGTGSLSDLDPTQSIAAGQTVVPMYRRFAMDHTCPRYPHNRHERINVNAVAARIDPFDSFERVHGRLTLTPVTWELVWFDRYAAQAIRLKGIENLVGEGVRLTISRCKDNWAWVLQNEFLKYETCSYYTRTKVPRKCGTASFFAN